MAEFDNATIEKLARDLCVRAGKGPDVYVHSGPCFVVTTPIGDRYVERATPAMPLWHCYVQMAVDVLHAARDLVPATERSP